MEKIALSRRAFCRRLHSMTSWMTYDIHAEASAVTVARTLLAQPQTTESILSAFCRPSSPAFVKRAEALVEFLSSHTVDNSIPVKGWKYGPL